MIHIKEQVDVVNIQREGNDTPINEVFTEQITIEEAEKWDVELKMEVIYWGQYEMDINKITRNYAKEHWKEILSSKGVDSNKIDNLYYVDSKTAEGKEHRYIYDSKVDIVYKVPSTNIGRRKVHSIEELDYQKGEVKENLITDDSIMVAVDGISYYEPDLSGFVLENTRLIYYSTDESMSTNVTISAEEYLKNGKQRIIEKNGQQYELYNYSKQRWANILIENSDIKSYWVWIPRYTYKLDDVSDIKFIDLNGTPETGYIVHSDFKDGKKGIWVSKYEPIQTANTEVEDFPYYIPDMSGFNTENTYIEVYDKETESFIETPLKDIENITAFARKSKWFDYNNKIWANIKVVNPEDNTESWWVWVPRYAYNITGNNTSIIFTDIYDNPLSGGTLPSNYTPHPAFGKDKKGIWVSKYEPVQKISNVGATNNVNPPDLRGYNVDNTYIECYDQNKNKFTEQTLRSILSDKSVINSSNVVEQVDIDYSKINGTWYSYDKKIWANIKVVDPDSETESWWVWIPRYAYNIIGTETTIIYLDANGNTLDGTTLPSNYVPHPAFNEAKEGIWASKYEPIQK